MSLLRESLKKYPDIEIEAFDGLLVDYAVQKNAQAILRGMRAVSDFEYEFQMALMNRRLNRNVQTVFLMTGLRWILPVLPSSRKLPALAAISMGWFRPLFIKS